MRTPERVSPRLVAFGPAAAAGVMLAITSLAFDLPFIAQAIALGAIVLSILAAIIPRRPEVRSHAATAFALLAALMAGQTRAGGVFVACAIAFALVVVVCMRAGRGQVVRVPRPRAFALVVGVAVAVSVPLALALPPSSRVIERRMGHFFAGRENDETGFSARMRLGSTMGMLQSDKVVMRIETRRGVQVDYLRGAVYDRYERREWTSSLDRTRSAAATPTTLDEKDAKIIVMRTAPVARWQEARWFLPANACEIATPSGGIEVDRGGIAHPDGKQWIIAPIAFRVRGCPPVRTDLAPPGKEDTRLFAKIHGQLAPIAEAWTKDAKDDREAIDMIVRRLAAFEYSLAVKRTFDVDPIVDFLTLHQAGHCEHFASALALLARTRGIPTRVVSGYRVQEVNPIDGDLVVRERNAHAWVEAWVDGAWRAYDPTPVVDMPRRSTAENVIDVARALAERLDRTTIALIFAGAGALFLGARRLLRALAERTKKETKVFAAEPALAPYVALEAALATEGHPREPSEPLEAFAARVAGLDAPWAPDVAKAIRSYAAFRYGNVGWLERVEEELTATTRRIGATSTSSS